MSDEDRYDDVYHSTFDSTGGRENSLCWSSITENVQFVDSNSSNETLSMQSNKLPSPPSGESGKDGYTEDDFESTEDYSSAESVRSMSKGSFSTCENLSTSDIKIKEDFVRRKIDILQIQSEKQHAQLSSELSSSQVEDLHAMYNKLKVKLIQSKSKDISGKGVPGKGVIKALKCHETNQSQLKNTRKLEMLKLDIAMVEVEKKISAPFHQPKQCRECIKLQRKVTEKEYVKKKMSQLQKQQFYEDLEEHLYQKGSAALIADIINSGPKPKDPPNEIWDRLLRSAVNKVAFE